MSNGTLTLNADGSFTYVPDADYNGPDSFTYHANDGAADSNVVTVDITVTPVNDAPVAAGDSYSTAEDTTLTVAAPGVLTNDTDIDGDPLDAVLDTDVSNGTLTLNADGSFTYVPDADWNGSDSFTYHASDGTADSNVVTVDITVTPVNDAPVAVADSYSTAEDTTLTVAAPGVLTNDSDVDGDPLDAVLDTDVSNGTLVLNADGSFTYVPDADWNGSDSFTYHANDGTADSNIVTVDITVTPVNDAPVATGDSYSTAEDTTLTVAAPGVLGNDTDVDGDPLDAVLDTDVSNGTLTLNADGSFTYVPDADWNGTDSFTYHANDGTADSNVVTVDITVGPVNDAPVAVADSYSTAEDATLTVAAPGVLVNDTDVDGDPLDAVLDTGVSNGTLTLNADGSFTYVPDADYNGPDSFTYHANDGTADSNVVTVDITVTPVNDAPVAVADSYSTAEDTTLTVAAPGVLGNDTDVEGDPISAVLVADVANGTLVLLADGSFLYTPDPDWNGTDSFTYYCNDGTDDSPTAATVTITVTPVNDAPVA
ncbi:MAG: tandem-95 repeat protein, partial [Actinobacteria bacterium]